MRRLRAIGLPLSGLFVCACAAVLLSVCRAGADAASARGQATGGRTWQVAWRKPLADRPNGPCASSSGWVVTDAGGGVSAWSWDGRPLWRASFSNQVFEGGAASDGKRILVAARDGRVYGLDEARGVVLWMTDVADAGFRHAPVIGRVGEEAVIWLVSQADGALVCLRQRDGKIVWRTEATNRCDGYPACREGRVAYGNCDGVVYLFDADDGKPAGNIVVGPDDQMAGGLLGDLAGRFWGGTRQGNLILVDAAKHSLEGKVKISDSEAFVTPVDVGGGTVATGTDEGAVVFAVWSDGSLRVTRRVPASAPVEEVRAIGELVGVLAGGAFLTCSVAGQPRMGSRLELGDDVYGLAVRNTDSVACIADQTLVCMKEALR